MPLPISIQLYTVRELTKTPADRERVIREIAEIGYVATEGGGDKLTDETRKLYKESGLRFSSWWAMPTKDNVGQLVDIAGECGFKDFVACVGESEFATKDTILRTAEKYESAAKLLAPHGLRMCYHNHWWEFQTHVDGRYGWDILFDHAPTLFAEIDLYWASNFGQVDVPALVGKYAAKTPLVHVKDGPLIKDQPHTACGQGKMDLPAVLAATDPGVTKWGIVELDHYVRGNENVMEAVRESYRYLTTTGLGTGRK